MPFMPFDTENLVGATCIERTVWQIGCVDRSTMQANEDLRLRYRYLDLRRTELTSNLKKRSEVAYLVRNVLREEGMSLRVTAWNPPNKLFAKALLKSRPQHF